MPRKGIAATEKVKEDEKIRSNQRKQEEWGNLEMTKKGESGDQMEDESLFVPVVASSSNIGYAWDRRHYHWLAIL